MAKKKLESSKPQILQRCVSGVSERLAKEKRRAGPNRADIAKAFAICTSRLQGLGRLKEDSQTLTRIGKEITEEHRETREEDLRRYERNLASARRSGEAVASGEMSSSEWKETLLAGFAGAAIGAGAMALWRKLSR